VTDSPQNTARTLQQRGLAVFYACWNSEKTLLYSLQRSGDGSAVHRLDAQGSI